MWFFFIVILCCYTFSYYNYSSCLLILQNFRYCKIWPLYKSKLYKIFSPFYIIKTLLQIVSVGMELVTITIIIITVRIERNKIDIWERETNIQRKRNGCWTENGKRGRERELLYYCNSSERLFERGRYVIERKRLCDNEWGKGWRGSGLINRDDPTTVCPSTLASKYIQQLLITTSKFIIMV